MYKKIKLLWKSYQISLEKGILNPFEYGVLLICNKTEKVQICQCFKPYCKYIHICIYSINFQDPGCQESEIEYQESEIEYQDSEIEYQDSENEWKMET
jgi:hypothetical protein